MHAFLALLNVGTMLLYIQEEIVSKREKQMKLTAIDNNGTLQGFMLVKSCDRKNTKNGSVYLDLVLADGDGDVVAKIWDFRGTAADQPQPSTVIRVRGTLNLYNGQPQFKIDRFRQATPEDGVDTADFVPGAPFSPELMYGRIIELAESFNDEMLKKLVLAVLDEYKDKIINLPGAFKLHHAIRGGLLMHTLGICRMAGAVTAVYPSVDRDLLLAGAILHDIAKAEEFSVAPTGLVDGYTVEGTLIGHLVKGAVIIDEIGRRNGIDESTLMLVEHMLISHHGEPEFGAAVRPLFLEAESLSELDSLDANIYEIENAVKDVPVGEFTSRMWALDDRKFFNHGRKDVSTDIKL